MSSLSSLAASPFRQVEAEIGLSESDSQVFDNEIAQRTKEQDERRAQISIWRQPLKTAGLFVLALRQLLHSAVLLLMRHQTLVLQGLGLLVLCILVYVVPGNHQETVEAIERQVLLGLWWVGLGVLSSVGLGTGLHTFILYLGPHIAKVTLTATSCDSVRFDTYGDDAFVCQDVGSGYSFWSIFRKVQLEAFLWGLGTALGELPPYFVARAARAANRQAEELDELAEEQQNPSLMTKLKLWVTKTVQKVGFVGILLFASIPNPLFDLAGLTCGHIGIPFWTFFIATCLGKAVVKVHGQTAFVITIFNVHYLEKLLNLLASFLSEQHHASLQASFEKQRQTFTAQHTHHQTAGAPSSSLFSTLWDLFLALMIGYFLVSIINSMAQGHQAALDELEIVELRKTLESRAQNKTNNNKKKVE